MLGIVVILGVDAAEIDAKRRRMVSVSMLGAIPQ